MVGGLSSGDLAAPGGRGALQRAPAADARARGGYAAPLPGVRDTAAVGGRRVAPAGRRRHIAAVERGACQRHVGTTPCAAGGEAARPAPHGQAPRQEPNCGRPPSAKRHTGGRPPRLSFTRAWHLFRCVCAQVCHTHAPPREDERHRLQEVRHFGNFRMWGISRTPETCFLGAREARECHSELRPEGFGRPWRCL